MCKHCLSRQLKAICCFPLQCWTAELLICRLVPSSIDPHWSILCERPICLHVIPLFWEHESFSRSVMEDSRGVRGGGSRWGCETSIENHQYLCIVFLHMHLLFCLMPTHLVGAHLVSWCCLPAILWWIGGVQDEARVGVDSQMAFTADGTRSPHGASVNSTALYTTVHLHYWQLCNMEKMCGFVVGGRIEGHLICLGVSWVIFWLFKKSSQ